MGQRNWLSKATNAVWSRGPVIQTAVVLLPIMLGLLSNLLQLYLFIGIGLAAVPLFALGIALLRTKQEPAPEKPDSSPQKPKLTLATESREPKLVPAPVSRSRRITGWALVALSGVVVLGLFATKQVTPTTTTATGQPTSSNAPSTQTSSPATSVVLTAPQGSFEEPQENAIVQAKVPAHGKITGLRADHQLILLMLYGDDTCYFPDVTQVAGDYWAGESQAGGDEAKGLPFTLNLADLGPKGVVALEEYKAAEKAAGSAPGICSQQTLAEDFDATILASVHIKRAP